MHEDEDAETKRCLIQMQNSEINNNLIIANKIFNKKIKTEKLATRNTKFTASEMKMKHSNAQKTLIPYNKNRIGKFNKFY